MALFFRTDKDPEGKTIRVDAGFRTKCGAHFLLLHRLPPHYPKSPAFIAELSCDSIELRKGEHSQSLCKAYAIQDFSTKELTYLAGTEPGDIQLPLLNLRYPMIARWMGKSFCRLSEAEIATLVSSQEVWKLVGGQR